MRKYLAPTAVVVVGVASHALNSAKAVVVEAYIQAFGLSPSLAGYLLTVEMTAATLGTVLATAFPVTLGGRRSLIVALFVTLIANIASVGLPTHSGPTLFGLRAFCGLGAGFGLGRLAISIAFNPRPDRLSGVYSVASASFAALIAFTVIPTQRLLGSHTIFVLLASPLPFALLLTPFFPVRQGSQLETRKIGQNDLHRRAGIVLALILYYLGLGAYWPFVGVVGGLSGVPHAAVASILGWAGVTSAVASLLAVFFGDRKTSGAMFNCLMALGIVSIVAPMVVAVPSVFLVSVCAFILSWFALFPFLLGFMSRLDPSGRMNGILYVIAAGCFAGGPGIAGWLIDMAPQTLVGALHLQWLTLGTVACGSAMLVWIHSRQIASESV